jgi:hypothetical protein
VWVEDVEDASLAGLGVLERPSVTVTSGRLRAASPPEPGLGLRLRRLPAS